MLSAVAIYKNIELSIEIHLKLLYNTDITQNKVKNMDKKQMYRVLTDPQIFEINRMKPASHCVYDDAENMRKQCLDGQWQFTYFPNFEQFQHCGDFLNLDGTDTTTVPSHVQFKVGTPQYNNVMYPWDGKENINPPEIPLLANDTVVLSRTFDWNNEGDAILGFDGFESAIFVWLNGIFVGYAENGFTPAHFDVSHCIEKHNKLVVVNVHYSSSSWLEDQDFWSFSGLFRSVNLYTKKSSTINDVEITTTSIEKSTATVKIAVACNENSRVTVTMDNITVAAQYDGKMHVATLTLSDVRLWNAEQPNLYKVTVTSTLNDSLSTVTTNYGIRTVSVDPRGSILVNGTRIYLKGVNRNEFHYQKGRAIDKDDIENDLYIIKRNGFNAIRTSHYPNQTVFYDICDKIGLYVIDETNLETHGTWQDCNGIKANKYTLPDGNPEWKANVLSRAERMLERDKNHPSVIMWSCGNESFGGKTLNEMAQYFRRRDNSRLVHYEGVFNDRRYCDNFNVESQMYTTPENVVTYLKNHPEKPFMLCEFAHAMGNSFGNVDEYYNLFRYPNYNGGFVWDFADMGLVDNRTKCLSGGQMGLQPNDGYFVGDGLLTSDRQDAGKMEEAKYLNGCFRFNFTETGIEITNLNSFADSSDYYFQLETNYGKQSTVTVFTAKIPPQQSVFRSFTDDITKCNFVTCSAYLNTPQVWADKGYCVAYGQHIFTTPDFTPCNYTNEKAQLVKGKFNTGCYIENGFASVRLQSALLDNLTVEGRQMLTQPLTPSFWRAPTDNDLANDNTLRWSSWKAASLYRKVMKLTCQGNTINAEFLLANGEKMLARYRFFKHCVEIEMTLPRGEGDIPMFGAEFTMPNTFSNVTYYGNTQKESYPDRRNGRLVGYKNYVANQQPMYLNPQEYGNKTDVSFVKICDNDGYGLEIASQTPFMFSAIPYTSHQLEHSTNAYELPKSTTTVVSIRSHMCGVGGDDSWGAKVHDKYLVKRNKPLKLKFTISIVKP